MKLIEEKELASLILDSYRLACLEEMGVDNWEGYSLAMDNYNADKYTDDELTEDYNEAY